MPSRGYNDYNKKGKKIEENCNSRNLILEQDTGEPTYSISLKPIIIM